MAYATAAQLAEALEIRVTPDNQQLLDDCLEAAATEIDHFLEGPTGCNCGYPLCGCNYQAPAIVVRTNVNRGVEWFKAPATYNGGVGFSDIGTMAAPASGFERHSAALLPLKTRWGIA